MEASRTMHHRRIPSRRLALAPSLRRLAAPSPSPHRRHRRQARRRKHGGQRGDITVTIAWRTVFMTRSKLFYNEFL
jgi:hypothetical protein